VQKEKNNNMKKRKIDVKSLLSRGSGNSTQYYFDNTWLTLAAISLMNSNDESSNYSGYDNSSYSYDSSSSYSYDSSSSYDSGSSSFD
jgi:hypothetical protein